MRKIFGFEITMAIKDRPRSFQLVTMALFSFSLTIIFVYMFTLLSAREKNTQVYQQNSTHTQASFVSTPSTLLNVRQK